MSDTQQGPGWWQASDLKWYPPAPPRLPPPPRKPLRPVFWVRWWKAAGWGGRALGLAVLLLVVAIAGVLIYRADQPNAREREFLHQIGDGGNDKSFDIGYDICGYFERGWTLRQVAALYSHNATDSTAFTFAVLANAAVADGSLCPQYAYRLDQP